MWSGSATRLVVPPQFFAELTSVLRNLVYRKLLTPGEGDAALAAALSYRVHQIQPAELQERAWALAKQFNRPTAYDAQYLAVAQIEGCDLWTADRRLVNATGVPWVRWLGDLAPTGA
jgi:predicted nucleic acid-binding protein